MKKNKFLKISLSSIAFLLSTQAFSQWTIHEGMRVDANGIGNGQHVPQWSFPGIVFGVNTSANSGEAIGSSRLPFSTSNQFGKGLDFHTNYSRRLHISNNGLLTLGAVSTSNPNKDANLEIQNTGTNIAFRAFPITNNFTKSISITSSSARPLLRFRDGANNFEMRGMTDGLVFNRFGQTSEGMKFGWFNSNGYLEVGTALNTGLLSNYNAFFQKGVKTQRLSTQNIGIGTDAPTDKLEIISGTPLQSGLKLTNMQNGVANNKYLTTDATGKVIFGTTPVGNVYTAGPGINISSTNVISSNQLPYVAGTGVSISPGNVINTDWDKNQTEIFNVPNKMVVINSPNLNGSGLRFNNLNANSILSPMSSLTCLGVDNNGEVILIPYPVSGGGGSGSKWTVNSTNGNHIFSNNPDNVGIGVQLPVSKLDVFTSYRAIAGQFITTKSGLSTGALGKGKNTGLQGEAEADLDLLQYGSTPTYAMKGVWGIASEIDNGITNNFANNIIGVKGEAYCESINATTIGVHGYADNSNSTNTWSIYGDGDAYSTTMWNSSDERLKTKIESIDNALEIINQLEAKKYQFKKDGKFANTNLPKGNSYGFLAQDLEKILPDAVKEAPVFFHNKKNKENEHTEMYKAINYTAIIPILTQAIKEQQNQIEELKNLIERVENSNPSKESHQINLKSENQETLSQNIPNPFTTNTLINYSIPTIFNVAKLGIYDLNGRELKLFNLADKQGSVTVEGSTLNPGMYIYTLIIDGKAIDSKKMILTSN